MAALQSRRSPAPPRATLYETHKMGRQRAGSPRRCIAAPAATCEAAQRSLLGAECGHEIRADRVTPVGVKEQSPGNAQITARADGLGSENPVLPIRAAVIPGCDLLRFAVVI